MARIVMKFGGTSLEGDDRLRAAAEKIAKAHREGNQVVAALSARGKETDRLIAQAKALCSDWDPREMDQLLATGELQSAALCAMALRSLGCPVISLSGRQAGIHTDGIYGNARILRIDTARMLEALEAGKVVLVAGFQGLSPEGDVTTLGRGGSDTTGVALAWALQADVCRIYTDVDGVYDKDPRKYPEAKKFDRIGYDAMLSLVDGGAQVLHRRSVEIAKRAGITVEVCSSLTNAPGTLVTNAEA